LKNKAFILVLTSNSHTHCYAWYYYLLHKNNNNYWIIIILQNYEKYRPCGLGVAQLMLQCVVVKSFSSNSILVVSRRPPPSLPFLHNVTYALNSHHSHRRWLLNGPSCVSRDSISTVCQQCGLGSMRGERKGHKSVLKSHCTAAVLIIIYTRTPVTLKPDRRRIR